MRRAGYRIESRALPRTTIDSAEQFGQALKFDRGAEIEQAHQNAAGKLAKIVAGHSRSDDGIVMRPDRTVVVRERVVARLMTADRPNTPSAEKILADQGVGHEVRAFGTGDP